MCGINAIYKFNGNIVNPEDLRKMSSSLSHRGPDESGFAILNQGSIGFSHVRLSIIDIGTGQQPMFNEDYSIAITYNGEVYDYQDYRKDLIKRGHKFRSKSDTEVIIHLYEEYGMDFLKRLNGEFAFVLWDGSKKKLIAVKDRSGIKPLFYHVNSNEIVFSSECKGIFALDRMERRLSTKYITGAFMGSYPKANSPFDGIHCLHPGHYMTVDFNGVHKEKQYWSQNYKVDNNMSFEKAKEGVRFLFRQAVKRRMVADVPVGVYLSGGVDSTLVCAMVANHGGRFKTYNIGFDNTVFDESSIAEKTAKELGADFETINCNVDKLAEGFEKTIYHTELALVNPHAIGKQLLSELINSQDRKVCITGEGADEIFAGYPYFKLERIWDLILSGGQAAKYGNELWEKFTKLEYRSEGLLWNRKEDWKNGNYLFGYPCFSQYRAQDFSPLVSMAFNTESLKIKYEHDPYQQFIKNNDSKTLKKLHPTNATRLMALNQLYSYIIPVLGDRVEMANSVECRTPFLDRDLIEFMGTVPPEYLINIEQLREKYVLHEAFKDDLPNSMRKDHKHPFLAPGWDSFITTKKGNELYNHFFSEDMLNKTQIFDPQMALQLKTVWENAPDNSETKKELNTMMGSALSLQMIDHLFIQNKIKVDPDFHMEDRSPT